MEPAQQPAHESSTISGPTVAAIAIAVLATILAIFALGRALASPIQPVVGVASGSGTSEPVSGAPASVAVELSEFAISPGEITVAAGGSLDVSNVGQIPHNLKVKGTDVATGDVAGGESTTLELGDLAPGTYELWCDITGHESGGMSGTLTVTEATSGAAGSEGDEGDAHGADDHAATPEEMEAAMAETMESFPAETEGEGAAVLEPTILDDGTKLFELTVDEVKWEVEPGKFVDALAYNGIVPGPTMYVDVGDRVTIRVQNDLDDEATSLHPHGLKDHAFEIDGVTYLSQDPIWSGDAMDYTFVAEEESVVTYHSHHMTLHQVPDGLFGVMVIGDYADLAGVEGVVDEQVMVLNDAGTIGFSLNGKSFPATKPYSYRSGDRMLVHYANEGQANHPMHLHNQAGTVIAKDGYLLPDGARYQGDTFDIAPGERLSVVYEMDEPGVWAWHCHVLSHVDRPDGRMFGMVTAVIVED